MSMTRKDFVVIANALREATELVNASLEKDDADKRKLCHQRQGISIAAGVIADALAASNPNFDIYRFLDATNPKVGK